MLRFQVGHLDLGAQTLEDRCHALLNLPAHLPHGLARARSAPPPPRCLLVGQKRLIERLPHPVDQQLLLTIKRALVDLAELTRAPDRRKGRPIEKGLVDLYPRYKLIFHAERVAGITHGRADLRHSLPAAIHELVQRQRLRRRIVIHPRLLVISQPVNETERSEESARLATGKWVCRHHVAGIARAYIDVRQQLPPGLADLGISGLEVERRRSEEHTSELQSRGQRVCRLLPER